jgi:hypothetical protein
MPVILAAQTQPSSTWAAINGKVVDARTGQPIAGAVVTDVLHNPDGTVAGSSHVSTDANGSYTATGAAPGGRYTFTVSAPGYQDKTASFTAPAAGMAITENFDLTPNAGGSSASTSGSSALQITDGPRIEYVGPNSAEVAWTTSTGGSTILRYGTNPNALNQTAEEPYAQGQGSAHVTHRVTVKNLQPNTTYYFIVDSGQGQGTGTEAKSSIQSFTTKPEGAGQGAGGQLAITDGPRVEYVGRDKAEIAWTTSTGGSSVIHYGTDPNNLSQTAQSAWTGSNAPPTGEHATHRVTVNNLQPNTTYYFVVDSGQGQGSGTEAKSPVAQFHTKQ